MASARDCAALGNEIKDLFEQLGQLLGDLTEAPQDAHQDAHVVIDQQLQHFFDTYYHLRERHEKVQLSVAVLALTKSGKSTFINSLLGQELLPVNNVPETARICRITHVPGNQAPELLLPAIAAAASSSQAPAPSSFTSTAAPSGPITGTAAVRDALQQLNHQVRAREHRSSGDEQLLQLSCSFSSLEGQEGEEVARLALIDTPGPNEAGEDGLRFQVERLLDGVDALIYLLDYTKLKTVEEASILTRLRSINPALVARLSTRLFFAVNKMDQAEESQGLGPDDTRAYVAELITRQMDCPGFTLHPDQVLLLSARDALLARLMLSGRADQTTQQRFLRLAFGMFAARRAPPAQEISKAAHQLLDGSGVPQLEERVLSYLYSHAAVLKLLATVDDLQRLIGQVSNVALSCRAALGRGASELQERYTALQGSVGASAQQLDEVLEATRSLEGEVTDELRAHLGNLRLRLYQYISATLDNYEAAAANAWAEALAATPVGASSTPGRWAAVRARFVALLTRGGGGGGGEGSDQRGLFASKDELATELMDLQDDLMQQIRAEVEEAWQRMEISTNARAAALMDTLNVQLDRLSRQVEGAVMEQLSVRLAPVTLHLVPPSAEEFHTDLEDLISKGVGEVHEHQLRTNERTMLEWQRVRGICRLRDTWVQVPRRRRMVEIYTQVSYQVAPDRLRDHFMSLVDTCISTTEAQLAGYVAAYVRRHVDAARRAIQGYSDRYLQAMGSAISLAAQTQEQRAAAIHQLDTYTTSLGLLGAKAADLATCAEALVPHNAGAAGVWEQMEYPSSDEEQQEGPSVAGAEEQAVAEETAAGGSMERQLVEEAPAPAPPAAAAPLAAAAAAGAAAAGAAGLLATAAGAAAAEGSPAAPPSPTAEALLGDLELGAAPALLGSERSGSGSTSGGSTAVSGALSSLASLDAMFEEAIANVQEGRMLAMQALPRAGDTATAAAVSDGTVASQRATAEEEVVEGAAVVDGAAAAVSGGAEAGEGAADAASDAAAEELAAGGAGGEEEGSATSGEDTNLVATPTAAVDAAEGDREEPQQATAGSEASSDDARGTAAAAEAAVYPYEQLLDDVLGACPLQVPPEVRALVREGVAPAFSTPPAAASQLAGAREEGLGAVTAAAKSAGSVTLPQREVLDQGFAAAAAAASAADDTAAQESADDVSDDGSSYAVVTTGDAATATPTPSSRGVQEDLANSLLGGFVSPKSDVTSMGPVGLEAARGGAEAADGFGAAGAQEGGASSSMGADSTVKPAAAADGVAGVAEVPDHFQQQDQGARSEAGSADTTSTPYASVHGSMYASIQAESDDTDASPNAAFLRSFNAAMQAFGGNPSVVGTGGEGGEAGATGSDPVSSDDWTLVAEDDEREAAAAPVPAASSSGMGSGLFRRRQ